MLNCKIITDNVGGKFCAACEGERGWDFRCCEMGSAGKSGVCLYSDAVVKCGGDEGTEQFWSRFHENGIKATAR